MKKIFPFLILVITFQFSIAQNFPDDIRPPSWGIEAISDQSPYKLPIFDLQAIQAEDAQNDFNDAKPWRFGYEFEVNHNFMTHGDWITLKNGDKIWRMSYKSNDALSLNFMFTEFYLPEGSKLYVYNDDKDDLLRPFTHHNNNPEEVLGTWLIKGNHAWIEYHQPAHVTEQAKLTVGGVVHGYRTAEMYQAFDLNDAENCHYDVDCDITPTPDPHDLNLRKEEVKKANAMLLVGGSGFCSGTLVNNTTNDGTPYVLTANHCGGNEAFWSFRFNWRSPAPSCGTAATSANGSFDQTVSGSVLRANSAQSDMELVEITDTSFFNNNPDVVWAGWNRSAIDVPEISFGIHHPAGDIQKVTRYDVTAQRTSTFFNNNPDTEVWFFSDFGLGFGEPGASGSALYNENGHIIGMLSGGDAFCSGTTSNANAIIYGRFDVAWDFGNSSSSRLRDWLDPANTGIEVLDIFPPVQVFDVDARVSVTNGTQDECSTDFAPNVTLINQGSLDLTSAEVSFFLDSEPATVVNWTGSLAQNTSEVVATPTYTDLSPGPHTFTVSVSNPNGVVDENTTNNNFVSSFAINGIYNTNNLIFDILTDDYASETGWELLDISSDVPFLVASGPTSEYLNNTTYQEVIALPTLDSCYQFILYDAASDGICCGFGIGSYTLSDDDGNIIKTGGEFGSTDATVFTASSTFSTTQNTLEGAITIFPNPVKDILTIKSDLNSGEDLNYVLYNILGQQIKSGKLSLEAQNQIDVSALNLGTFLIELTSESGRFIQKIIKE